MTPNDSWVCDFDITRNTGDYNDHPQLMLKSANSTYASPSTNGENQLLLQYAGNGNTGNSSGTIGGWNVKFREGGTNYQAGPVQVNYCQNVGTTLYYRMYMSKTGDGTRYVRKSAWTSDAYRTAEGSTGREIDSVGTTALNSGWSSSDDLRYLIVVNKNNNQANWTLSNFKFWNGVVSSGVADNMLSHTPTINLNFTDGYAGDTKPTNVQVGSRYEETDTRKMYHYESGLKYEDNFSSNGDWVFTTSNASITGGVLQCTQYRSANDSATVSVGTSIGTKFLQQFEYEVDSYPSSNGSNAWYGLWSLPNTTGANTGGQDFVVLLNNDGVNHKISVGQNTSAYGGTGSTGSTWIVLTVGTKYYIELIGNGDDTYTLNIRTVSHTGSHVTNSPQTVTKTGLSNLQYFGFKNTTGGGNGGTVTKTDDLKIYKGITTAGNVWSEEGT